MHAGLPMRAFPGLLLLVAAWPDAYAQAPAEPVPAKADRAPQEPTPIPPRGRKPEARTEFRVKYVGEGVVYLDGGRSAGLAAKMRLTVSRKAVVAAPASAASGAEQTAVAELVVYSVADNSAVCEVASFTTPILKGDVAALKAEDAQLSQILRRAGTGTHYAQTITFDESDPMDEEARQYVPHPALPEVNRVRGRIGFEYNSILDAGGTGANAYNAALVVRADITRIGGTYWSLSGYSRFLLNSATPSSQQTISDLMNRTYHIVLRYDDPRSRWVAGFGRFYLPWAASLSTIDGGYVGRRLSQHVTTGMFAGTTPDPTSWNYNSQRKLLGSFINFEGGDYQAFRYSSTSGLGLSRLVWAPEREFLFFENTLSWKRLISIYHDMQVDQVHANPQQAASASPSLSRSFLTLRVQPSQYVTFDLNDSYFRDFPTFDARLIGTGLLDRYLFQGLSGGVRFSLPYHASLYTEIGRSKSSSDTQPSWNRMFGAGLGDILHSGIQADYHYTHFDSTFGKGNYQSVSLTRQMRESLRLMVQAGQQNYTSAFTQQTQNRFVTGTVDWNFTTRYFLGGGVTVYRGGTQNYNQTYLSVGCRF